MPEAYIQWRGVPVETYMVSINCNYESNAYFTLSSGAVQPFGVGAPADVCYTLQCICFHTPPTSCCEERLSVISNATIVTQSEASLLLLLLLRCLL